MRTNALPKHSCRINCASVLMEQPEIGTPISKRLRMLTLRHFIHSLIYRFSQIQSSFTLLPTSVVGRVLLGPNVADG